MDNTHIEISLVSAIKELIASSRNNIAVSVNAEMTMLYWHIGQRINEEILQHERAAYGKQIVQSISVQLIHEYGSGWSVKQLRHCLRFAEVFTDETIVSTLWRQLTWSHIKEVIYIDSSLKRMFYIEMCKIERWSVRTFRERINSMLYERTAISKKPEETVLNDLTLLQDEQKISPDLVFRDPYFLDFLGLKDTYSERDLESAILAELQNFLTELGSDFAFMARQKRITIDSEDYYMDLLFYHRRLKCLVVIDLKLGKFEAADKGQMELYLRWLEKNDVVEGENPPIGLILCAHKNEEHVELLQLDRSNIKIAEYLTQLPDLKLLEAKLHQSIERAKNRYSLKEKDNEQ
jgi:predicted nuclease of restriction endonuclease-like (RecB) superfamily